MSDDINNNDTSPETTSDEAAPAEAKAMSLDKIVDERGVPLSNVLKEQARKLGKLSDISAKLDLLLQHGSADNASNGDSAPDVKLDDATKRYIDARLNADKKMELEKAQKETISKVYKSFPELNQDSDQFDSNFFDLAVEHEKTISPTDPQRSLKAAKLAALDLGKIEQITKAQILQDEKRRTRYLEEGGAEMTAAKAKKSPTISQEAANNLKRYLKIDAKKVEAQLKGRS
jgi:hypothetical protein